MQFAQELLQTFGTSIGEIALIPVTGGIFTVKMTHIISDTPQSTAEAPPSSDATVKVGESMIWDRKVDGGFPETKELKNRVRNIIEPGRDLGHIDRSLKKGSAHPATPEQPSKPESRPDAEIKDEQKNGQVCEDCR
jgi:predicted Rdx family selenoprotein